jgi:hypothetical protein
MSIMAINPSALIVQHIRSLSGKSSARTPDRELVRRFVGERDEAAFAALVQKPQRAGKANPTPVADRSSHRNHCPRISPRH